MGDARRRAIIGYTHDHPFSTPNNADLYRWRLTHPRGRRFSCYQRDVRMTIGQIARYLQARGQAMYDAVREQRERGRSAQAQTKQRGGRLGLIGAMAAMLRGGSRRGA